MTKDEQVARLCQIYSKLAEMNHENLVYRIKFEALGKSDASTLATKLLALKDGGKVDPKSPEDEQIWSDAMLTLLPVAKAPAKPAKKDAE